MERWYVLNVGLLMFGGLLACAGLIIQNAPSARRIFNSVLPYKALVGVGLLGSFAVNLHDSSYTPLAGFDLSMRFGALILAIHGLQLVLGFTMGFGQVAKWIPGDTAPEERAEAVQRSLMPYEVLLGALAIVAGILAFVFARSPDYFY